MELHQKLRLITETKATTSGMRGEKKLVLLPKFQQKLLVKSLLVEKQKNPNKQLQQKLLLRGLVEKEMALPQKLKLEKS